MTSSDRAAALITWWVTVYTRRLSPEVADRRQAELASDLWEQRAHAYQDGTKAPLVALAILRRAVAGIPADLQWRHGQLAAARGAAPQEPGPMRPGPARRVASAWWLVLAALLAGFEIVASVGSAMLDTAFDTPWQAIWSGYLTTPSSAGGVLMVVGLGLRSRTRARVAGDLLLAIGAFPLAQVYGAYGFGLAAALVPGAALAVVAMAVLDADKARGLGRRGAARSRGSRGLLAAAVVLVTALAATVIAIAGDRLLVGGRVVTSLMYGAGALTLVAATRRRPA